MRKVRLFQVFHCGKQERSQCVFLSFLPFYAHRLSQKKSVPFLNKKNVGNINMKINVTLTNDCHGYLPKKSHINLLINLGNIQVSM